MVAYADTGFLVSLYLEETASKAADTALKLPKQCSRLDEEIFLPILEMAGRCFEVRIEPRGMCG